MGGRVAIYLALSSPEKIDKLCVVDIAPVAYKQTFSGFFKAMREVEEADVSSVADADRILAKTITDEGVRQFVLTNLNKSIKN